MNCIYPSLIPSHEGSPTVKDVDYIKEYLQKHIGKKVKIEFLIGANLFIDREGIIKEVGKNYIIITKAQAEDLLIADLYSIKFIRIYKLGE